ncbi:glutathione S-transferase N-terminal domain-containing protein [Sessilibacter sp. MAH1]
MIVKVLRNATGAVVVGLDLLTRWSRVKRSTEGQNQVNNATKNMKLYHFLGCPFCVKTRRAMYKLNLPIETRSVTNGSPYRESLLNGGGKIQVPCLHIQHEDGKEEWMYESKSIIAYLNNQFADIR